MAFIALFELGSLVCAVSTSSNMFIVGRAIAGMGSSGVSNGALTILSASIPLEKRARTLRSGLRSGPESYEILLTALKCSLLWHCGIMYVLLQVLARFNSNPRRWSDRRCGLTIDWRCIDGICDLEMVCVITRNPRQQCTPLLRTRLGFYINLPIGGLAVLFLHFISLPEHGLNRPEQRSEIKFASLFSDLDIIGFLLLSPTLVMFLLALEWGGTTYPWNTAMVIGLFCGSAGNLALFLSWEYKKGDAAMIPLKMIKQRVVCSSSLTMFFLYANSLICSYYLAIYFQGVRGEPPMFSGMYMLPGVIAQMISGFLSGLAGMYRHSVIPNECITNAFKVTRLGYYLPSAVTGTVLSAVGSGLMSIFTPHTSIGTWIGCQIIAGVGRGCALQMV